MISTSSVKSNTAFGPRLYKLPAVKECLYHPQLPTFRRMDIDTAAHKLPDEHCRTTTRCKNGKMCCLFEYFSDLLMKGSKMQIEFSFQKKK